MQLGFEVNILQEDRKTEVSWTHPPQEIRAQGLILDGGQVISQKEL